MIFLDHRQREIDASRDPCGGIKLPIFQKQRIRLEFQFRKTPRDILRMVPMRSSPASIKKSAWREAVDPGAHRGNASNAARSALDPCRYGRGSSTSAQSWSAGNDQRVQRGRVLQRVVGLEDDAGLSCE